VKRTACFWPNICAGKDATEEFEEIGHSSTAQEMLEKYLIGNFAVRFHAKRSLPCLFSLKVLFV
jgi:cytochrome b involved in lipid metabolism